MYIIKLMGFSTARLKMIMELNLRNFLSPTMIKCLKEVRFIKKNVDEKNFLLTLGISSNDFFRILKKNCDKVSNKYNVILRLKLRC